MSGKEKIEDPDLLAIELVDDLYSKRDHFFESHDISEASEKNAITSEHLRVCLEKLESLYPGDGSQAKALALYLRGRALNIVPDHSPEAEKLLSRAVKLDPNLVEAWNELGEAYWKRGDVVTAKTCFEGALEHKVNKVSLRNLSIALRQEKCNTTEDLLRNIETGLSKAREAVQLDTSDGISWTILGNAYLKHFFAVSQNPRTLKQAMSAYKQAEKDVIAASSSELFYNKGVALRYEEDYNGALGCFDRAIALDPTWPDPAKQKKSLYQLLSNVQSLIELKGKLKTKRFNSLVESIHEKHLGPYGGGKFSSGSSSVTLKPIEFHQLREGLNQEKVILGKVICSLHSSDTVPFTFCMSDRTGQSLAVNLYNLAPGKGVIIGDSVAIAEPFFSKVKIEGSEKPIEFDLIRVDSPLVLVINGRKASPELQAGIELATFTKSD